MDSCSSSPSHAFKDRSRSRHDDLKRQPPCLDRAKSPAPKTLSDSKEKIDVGRDLVRRSYGACSSDKEAGDALLESSDRGRNSLRRSFGFERSDRHRDTLTERYRSTRSGGDGSGGGSRTPSRNHDRESLETGGRPSSRRSSHVADPHRHEVSEGVSSSPLQDERDYEAATRKGHDKERHDSGDFRRRGSCSPEHDGDACKSPSSGKGFGFIKRDGRDFFKFSPRRSSVSDRDGVIRCSPRKDFGLEKDCTRTPRSSPREKEGMEKHRLSSPRKTLGRERAVRDLDDMDVTSPKSKFRSIKEEEKHKEQGASSGETDTRSWNRSFSSRSRGAGEDLVEEEHWHEASGSHEEVWRARSPPITFFRISKRARSDRDRGRREELNSKVNQRHVYGNELGKADRHKAHSAEKLDLDVAGKKEGAVNEGDVEAEAMDEAKDDAESLLRNVDAAVVQSNERPFDKVQTRYSVSNHGDKSDMEEGELEPEGYVMEKQNELDTINFAEQKTVDMREGEEDDSQNCAVPIHATEGKEACEGMLKVVTEVENQPNDESHEIQDESNKKCEDGETSSLERKEQVAVAAGKDTVNLQLQRRSMQASTTEVLEIGESSKGGLKFDLLDARTEAKSWNLNSADKGHDSSREVTLSLFTKPVEVGAQGESSEPKGHTLGSQSKLKEQNGKQIERDHNSEVRMTGQHLGGSGEESSQHSGHKQKKLKIESLQLSLALPGTSTAAGGSNPPRLAGPPEPERSFQSLTHTQTQTQNFSQSQTHTNSDGFTTSFSFSQSQSFIHNPSCSLNCTSLENQELSCGGSRQISQGTEHMSHRSWPALSGNEQMSNGMHTVTSLSQDRSKHRRGIPLYQRMLQNGNIHQGFPSVTGSNRSSGSNHVSQRSHQFGQRFQEAPKILDSSSQDLEGSGRQATPHKDLMERVREQKAWFASKQQAMFGETRSEPNALQGRERLVDPPASNAQRLSSVANDTVIGERNILSEKIGLHEIATEPVAIMAQKLQELSDSFLEGLKGLAKGMLGSFEKREEFITLQENIRRRVDLTEDTLLRAHRTQLEILVALKTGMQAFVKEGSKPQTYKALIDIFLQTRCRNIACQQSLPVSGCECRICSKKSGFCHDCMCVVCFKFDSDNNTCRWVGCDVCLHWCHTDCGLRMSYIAPTPSIQSATGTTEMQYHCVACDHKSELFGFVKEVFHKCAEVWGAETLAKELDCVRRIFHGSEDMRGKQLCWKAEQMLQKLENKVDAAEVCRSMLRFFNEGNAELDGACTGPNKKPSSFKPNDAPDHVADPGRETISKATSSGGNKPVDLDKARVVLQTYDRNLEEKRTEAAELQYDRARKRAEIEDIESAVRIKQAEANMFQVRADEARQEAGGLQRIISVKREKIDEDYAFKYAKLRLSEAEERQRKRFEELQALESAQHDFQKMKIRMEAEIKELLMKMEIAKRQFT